MRVHEVLPCGALFEKKFFLTSILYPSATSEIRMN